MEYFTGKGQRDASGALSRRLCFSERRADNSMYVPRSRFHSALLIVVSCGLVQTQDRLFCRLVRIQIIMQLEHKQHLARKVQLACQILKILFDDLA